MIAPNTRILWLPESDARNWNYETGDWASAGNRNPSGVRMLRQTFEIGDRDAQPIKSRSSFLRFLAARRERVL
jgi:hypothetical protein